MFREYDPENREKLQAKMGEWVKERKRNPEKYGRYMRLQDGTATSFSMIGKNGGTALMEFDNEEQLQNTVSFWASLIQYNFVPIIQTAQAKTKEV